MKYAEYPMKQFFLDVKRGAIDGMSADNKFGANPATSTSFEDVWDYGGSYTFFSAAVVLGVSSSDANDAAAGTGARTVRIYGLDTNYAEQTEDVTLNGQTKVETTKSFLRVYRVKVLTAGSGGVNAGDVYAYDTSDSVVAGVPQTATKVQAMILADYGQTEMCIRPVPANKKMYICGVSAGMADVASKTGFFEIQTREFGGVWQVKRIIPVGSGIGISRPFNVPIEVDAKADVKVRCKSSAAAVMECDFDYILADTA